MRYRVFLPTKPDGAATVTHDTYAAVGAIARWAKLPPEVVNRGRTEAAGKRPPRRVQALDPTATQASWLQAVRQSHAARVYGRDNPNLYRYVLRTFRIH